MEIRDERTKVQREATIALVVAVDDFMSGWGRAKNGRFLAAWAVYDGGLPEQEVLRRVKERKGMRRAHVVSKDYPKRARLQEGDVLHINDYPPTQFQEDECHRVYTIRCDTRNRDEFARKCGFIDWNDFMTSVKQWGQEFGFGGVVRLDSWEYLAYEEYNERNERSFSANVYASWNDAIRHLIQSAKRLYSARQSVPEWMIEVEQYLVGDGEDDDFIAGFRITHDGRKGYDVYGEWPKG